MADPYSDAAGVRLAQGLAQRTGTVAPPEAWRAFAAQVANETNNGDPSSRGVRNNNPLNLKAITPAQGGPWPGQVGTDGPFAVFSSVSDGINAAATNYTAPSYASVLTTFQFGDPYALAKAIEASPWAVGGYGGSLSNSLAPSPSPPPPSASSQAAPSAVPAAGGPPVPTIASRLSGGVPLGILGQIGFKAIATVGAVALIFVGIVKLAGGNPAQLAKTAAVAAK